MKIKTQREALLKPLQAVIGVVERRQTMPILANVLMSAKEGKLAITATDLEVELVASSEIEVAEPGDVTVPGRKLLDICKALPDGAKVSLGTDGERIVLRSGRSRFTLSTLPAAEFPVVEDVNAKRTLTTAVGEFRRVLEKTHFAMAHQDVRYYLNGLLLEIAPDCLRAVATDGHRLALCETPLKTGAEVAEQVIVPRKGVLELQRLLSDAGDVTIQVGTNHLRIEVGNIRFTSKLIDGRFPDYTRVIPPDPPYILSADRETLRHALGRTAILSNEKYRGIRLEVMDGKMLIQAHNPEQEEAEEELEVSYEGEQMEIGFNVSYLLDAMAAVDGDTVHVALTDSNSSCLISAPDDRQCRYVVMPMRL